MGDFLGIDTDAAPGLSTVLRQWQTDVDDALTTISQAETLSDLVTGVHLPLDEIGTDGTTMASAVDAAMLEALGFQIDLTVGLGPPPEVDTEDLWSGYDRSGVLDDPIRFSDDPERATSLLDVGFSPQAAADFVNNNGSPADHTFGTNAHAQSLTALELWQIVSGWEASGRSANDPIFDTFNAELNARSNELAGADAPLVDINDVITAEITGLDVDAVRGLQLIDRIDELAAERLDAPSPALNSINAELNAALLEFAGGDEELAAQINAALANGLTLGETLNLLDTISILDLEPTPIDIARMAATAHDLADANFTMADANAVAAAAAATGFDPEDLKAIMVNDGSTVFQAVTALAAENVAMTVDEFGAYNGLVANFEFFDGIDGDANGLVSRDDLRTVINAPDGTYDAHLVATAQALLDHEALFNRIDDAGANEDILDELAFGNVDTGDGKISTHDLNSFALKQFINTQLHPHAAEIDVAKHGGEVDYNYSYGDFQAFLDQNPDLSEEEVNAVTLLLEAGLHDQTWWEENKRAIALGLAVVAGAAFVVLSGGTGLILLAGGAAAGGLAAGGATLIMNAASDEFAWDDQLYSNTALGAVAGAGSAALAEFGLAINATGSVSGGLTTLGGSSTIGQVAVASGLVADVSGLVGMGAFDAALDPGLALVGQQDKLDEIHDVANTVSLVTGLPAGAFAISQIPRAVDAGLDRLANRWVDGIIPPRLNGVNSPGVTPSGAFTTNGPTPAEINAFLSTPDGTALINQLAAMDPGASSAKLLDRATGILESGSTTPAVVPIPEGTPMVKIVPAGEAVSPYTGYWTTPDALQEALDQAARGNYQLLEGMGLPASSHATTYDIYSMTATADTEGFAAIIAPTTELPFETPGGALQVVVPNRTVFDDPVLISQTPNVPTVGPPNATVIAGPVTTTGQLVE